MKIEFRDLVNELGGQLVAEHGFRRSGRRFTRDDGVLRSAWFRPGASLPGEFHFEILFDLGISGISTFSTTAQTWIVRASAGRIRLDPDQPRLELKLTGDDVELLDRLRERCAIVYRDLLLRHDTAEDLYRWLADGALGFHADHTIQDDFARFNLQPRNMVPRLELAAVYAAHLGHLEDADRIAELAVAEARRIGLRYAIPGIRQSVADATRV